MQPSSTLPNFPKISVWQGATEARHAKISEPGIKIINKYQQNTEHKTQSLTVTVTKQSYKLRRMGFMARILCAYNTRYK